MAVAPETTNVGRGTRARTRDQGERRGHREQRVGGEGVDEAAAADQDLDEHQARREQGRGAETPEAAKRRGRHAAVCIFLTRAPPRGLPSSLLVYSGRDRAGPIVSPWPRWPLMA